MKKALVLFLLIAATVHAQELPGFMGIKFGTKYNDAKTALLSKEGAILNSELTDSTRIIAENVKWGIYTSSFVRMFIDDSLGMHTATVYLKPEESDLFTKFDDVVKSLKGKYGPLSDSLYSFQAPYQFGDGHALEAVQAGKATFDAEWHFPDGQSQSVIVVNIDKNALIEVTYQSYRLFELARVRMNSKVSGDY